jgi:hypothetical protein
VADQETVKLLNDIAKFGANQMWHFKPDTAAGKLYVRIEQEIARLENPAAPSDLSDLLRSLDWHSKPGHMQNDKTPVKRAMQRAAELLRSTYGVSASSPSVPDTQQEPGV